MEETTIILDTFKKHYVRAKAELQGVAKSHARMLKQAKDIVGISSRLAPGRPRPTGDGVRMSDGKPMAYFTDGSLRHLVGRKTTKAARKALKRARRLHGARSIRAAAKSA